VVGSAPPLLAKWLIFEENSDENMSAAVHNHRAVLHGRLNEPGAARQCRNAAQDDINLKGSRWINGQVLRANGGMV
jgi:hypothetical protein